jgi:hypothetical protein
MGVAGTAAARDDDIREISACRWSVEWQSRQTNTKESADMSINFDRLSIRPGEYAHMEIGFSEAACHMRIAGKTMLVQLLPNGRMVQVYNADETPFSFPITYGEAGIYRDAAGFYHY